MNNGGVGENNLRVVLADDDAETVSTLLSLLGLHGYHAWGATDGVQARRLVRRHDPHVVLLDLVMPPTSGYAVARQIREEFGAHPVLVAVTGNRRDADQHLAMRSGFNHYVTKPYVSGTLMGLLRRIADRLGGAHPLPPRTERRRSAAPKR